MPTLGDSWFQMFSMMTISSCVTRPEHAQAPLVQSQCRSIRGHWHLPNLRLSVMNCRQPARSRLHVSIRGKAHTSGTPRVGLPEDMSMMVSTLRVRPAVALDVLQDSHACHHQQGEENPHWTIMVHKCLSPDPPHLRTHPPQESNLATNSSNTQISTPSKSSLARSPIGGRRRPTHNQCQL